MSTHFALGRILRRGYNDSLGPLLLLQHNVAFHSWILWNSEDILARRCRAQKPSISAWYELAVEDRSQKVPVSRSLVLLHSSLPPFFDHTTHL